MNIELYLTLALQNNGLDEVLTIWPVLIGCVLRALNDILVQNLDNTLRVLDSLRQSLLLLVRLTEALTSCYTCLCQCSLIT